MDALPLPAPGSVDAEVEDARSEAKRVACGLSSRLGFLAWSDPRPFMTGQTPPAA